MKLSRAVLAFVVLGLADLAAAECETEPGLSQFYQSGWGIDLAGQRFQSDTTVNTGSAQHLSLKWAYGFGTNQPRVFPLVTEDTIFIGDGGVGLVALDRDSGCTRWINEDVKDAATAVSHGDIGGITVLVLSGRQSGVIAIDAATGETIWQRTITEDNPVVMYSGSPLVFEDQVFVPLSSAEIGLVIIPFYGCCTTSGAMAALDLATGETNWYLRTIPDQPQVTGRHYLFVEEHGPSGAPVWNAPDPWIPSGVRSTSGLVRTTAIQPPKRLMRFLRWISTAAKHAGLPISPKVMLSIWRAVPAG